jgi:hypothetical protein
LNEVELTGFILPEELLAPSILSDAAVTEQATESISSEELLASSILSAVEITGVVISEESLAGSILSEPELTETEIVVSENLTAGSTLSSPSMTGVTAPSSLQATALLSSPSMTGIVFSEQLWGLATVNGVVLSTIIPETPTLTAGMVTNSPAQITANWTDVPGADKYTLYYTKAPSLPNGGETTSLSNLQGKIENITSLVYTINGPLDSGATYYIKISATNTAGTSALSVHQGATAAPATAVSTLDTFDVIGTWTGGTLTAAYDHTGNGGNSLTASDSAWLFEDEYESYMNPGVAYFTKIYPTYGTLTNSQFIASFWVRGSGVEMISVEIWDGIRHRDTYSAYGLSLDLAYTAIDSTWRKCTITSNGAGMPYTGNAGKLQLAFIGSDVAGSYLEVWIDDVYGPPGWV